MAINLKVNGSSRTVQAEPDTPLLYVLRNDLELNGAKFGCGLDQCGACTVLVDGAAMLACRTTLGEVAGRSVTTIEGLASGRRLHPIQQALAEERASQCGSCTPGMALRAAALLAEGDDPGADWIAAALGRNVCRCGCYPRLVRAVHRAAAALRDPGRPEPGPGSAPAAPPLGRPRRRRRSPSRPPGTSPATRATPRPGWTR